MAVGESAPDVSAAAAEIAALAAQIEALGKSNVVSCFGQLDEARRRNEADWLLQVKALQEVQRDQKSRSSRLSDLAIELQSVQARHRAEEEASFLCAQKEEKIMVEHRRLEQDGRRIVEEQRRLESAVAVLRQSGFLQLLSQKEPPVPGNNPMEPSKDVDILAMPGSEPEADTLGILETKATTGTIVDGHRPQNTSTSVARLPLQENTRSPIAQLIHGEDSQETIYVATQKHQLYRGTLPSADSGAGRESSPCSSSTHPEMPKKRPAAQACSPAPKKNKFAGKGTPLTLDVERTIQFDEVSALAHETIFPWPSSLGVDQFYILRCDMEGACDHCKTFKFRTPKPLIGAVRHLRTKCGCHDFRSADHHFAVQTIGRRVLGCDPEKAETHNQRVAAGVSTAAYHSEMSSLQVGSEAGTTISICAGQGTSASANQGMTNHENNDDTPVLQPRGAEEVDESLGSRRGIPSAEESDPMPAFMLRPGRPIDPTGSQTIPWLDNTIVRNGSETSPNPWELSDFIEEDAFETE